LSLQTGQSYYVNVRATDAAGNATISSSDGQIVAPTLAFAISDPSIDLGSLQPGTVATDTLTMTTSTNAYSGYQVRAKLTQLLTTTAGSTIQNFSAGSYAAPATWGPTDYGLGYTSSDTSIQGLGNHFGTGTLFAPFVTGAGQGNVVADHTATVTSPVINESSDLTIKLAAPLLAIAGVYSTTLVVTAVATF
jgi:hypothetical protein